MNELALIIEDDEDLVLIFAEALRAVDYEVETIADANGRSKGWTRSPPT